MEFKYINDRNKTPKSKSCVFSTNSSCDSHLKFLPNYSTPPSRFSKIVNPFEKRLSGKIHLSTFSPSVFATVSTPKTGDKFKWTIDDISSLKPADIDEATISQHVFDEDPHVEFIEQQKIDEFFSEKVIVPSPMVDIVRVPLVADSPENLLRFPETKEYCEGSAQTVLSLPPILPPHIEDILKPYYLPLDEKVKTDNIADMKDTSLFQNLFNFKNDTGCSSEHDSLHSVSQVSRKEFYPVSSPVRMDEKHSFSFEMPDLQDCSLSPIGRKQSPKGSRSACRLDFSSRMSLEASLVVPDMCNDISNNSILLDSSQNFQQPVELLSNSSTNWEMEYRHVSFVSPCSSPESSKMDMSTSNTPHSKLFTSQRKRLSDSFKIEDDDYKENIPQIVYDIKQGRRLFRNDVTDRGYYTGSICEESRSCLSMFASTPSKTKNILRSSSIGVLFTVWLFIVNPVSRNQFLMSLSRHHEHGMS